MLGLIDHEKEHRPCCLLIRLLENVIKGQCIIRNDSCNTSFIGLSLLTIKNATIPLYLRFGMSERLRTDKSSKICQKYELVPSETEFNLIKLAILKFRAFQWA